MKLATEAHSDELICKQVSYLLFANGTGIERMSECTFKSASFLTCPKQLNLKEPIRGSQMHIMTASQSKINDNQKSHGRTLLKLDMDW